MFKLLPRPTATGILRGAAVLTGLGTVAYTGHEIYIENKKQEIPMCETKPDKDNFDITKYLPCHAYPTETGVLLGSIAIAWLSKEIVESTRSLYRKTRSRLNANKRTNA